MLIRSQDGRSLVEDSFGVITTEAFINDEAIVMRNSNISIMLGRYADDKEVKSVIKKIMTARNHGQQTFKMPISEVVE